MPPLYRDKDAPPERLPGPRAGGAPLGDPGGDQVPSEWLASSRVNAVQFGLRSVQLKRCHQLRSLRGSLGCAMIPSVIVLVRSWSSTCFSEKLRATRYPHACCYW